MNYLN